MNLGSGSPASQSASYGIFSHHGNIPRGVRLAVEHAMHLGLARFVVCTSTLAQGVNLPIRYLIANNVYQGTEPIKVRDFHNLIGRAGRAGMHTEGSVLFSDPAIYDKRSTNRENWRWNQVRELLDPQKSEPCISNILSIFDPIKNDNGHKIFTLDALKFVEYYIHNPADVDFLAAKLTKALAKDDVSFNNVKYQIDWKISLISAIESFLLSHLDEIDESCIGPEIASNVERLAKETLAYFLASDQDKTNILSLFRMLAENIFSSIPDPYHRTVYGQTLYGVQDARAVEEWVLSNSSDLLKSTSEAELLNLTWPLMTHHITNHVFHTFNNPETLKAITLEWIMGAPFNELLYVIQKSGTKMLCGTQEREFKVDHVVDVCENALAYDGALLIGSIYEFIRLSNDIDDGVTLDKLQFFQKQIQYGLPTKTSIALYEIGFQDRVIAQDLEKSLNLLSPDKSGLLVELHSKRKAATDLIEKYPKYFQNRLDMILH